MNAALAPRDPRCRICKGVAAVDHVTVLLYDEDGAPRRTFTDAKSYLRSIGWSQNDLGTQRALRKHRDHIDRFLAGPGEVTPAQMDTVTRIAPPGNPSWLDVQAQAKHLGSEAMKIIASRLVGMDDAELVAVAKMGTVVAAKQADLEAKGRRLGEMDKMLRVAAGMPEK